MIRFHFFPDSLKEDALAILRRLKPRRDTMLRQSDQTIWYYYHWFYFSVVITRDIRKTKWKDLQREITK